MALQVTGTIPPGVCYPPELQSLAVALAQILSAPAQTGGSTGGGTTTAKTLYVQTSQPSNVPEGTLWFNPAASAKVLSVYATTPGSSTPTWQQQVIPLGSVTTAMLANGAVSKTKLAVEVTALLDSIAAGSSISVTALEEQSAGSSSYRANFFIMSDGTLRVTGFNGNDPVTPTTGATTYSYYGKNGIGNNGADASVLPKRAGFSPPLGSDRAVKVYAGQASSFVLTEDGNVYATGFNDRGQLGLGDTINRYVFTRLDPAYFGSDPVKQLAIGSGPGKFISVYAVTTTGKLYSWGHNYYGQLGLAGPVVNNTNQPTSPQLIAALGSNVKAIVSAGGGPNATTGCKVSAWALMNDGSVKACGFNADGQLGVGGTASKSEFTDVPDLAAVSRIVAIGNGVHATAFFLLAAGGVKSVGYNKSGQMCVGSAAVAFDTVQVCASLAGVTVADMVAFDGGDFSSALALASDGTLRAWGYNASGQLGLGPAAGVGNQTSAATPNIQNVSAIAMGGGAKKISTAILRKPDDFDAVSPTFEVYSAGNNEQGALGLGDKVNRNVFSRVLIDSLEVLQLAFGSNNDASLNGANLLLRLRNGNVLAVGYDTAGSGQLGADVSPAPLTVPAFVNF